MREVGAARSVDFVELPCPKSHVAKSGERYSNQHPALLGNLMRSEDAQREHCDCSCGVQILLFIFLLLDYCFSNLHGCVMLISGELVIHAGRLLILVVILLAISVFSSHSVHD